MLGYSCIKFLLGTTVHSRTGSMDWKLLQNSTITYAFVKGKNKIASRCRLCLHLAAWWSGPPPPNHTHTCTKHTFWKYVFLTLSHMEWLVPPDRKIQNKQNLNISKYTNQCIIIHINIVIITPFCIHLPWLINSVHWIYFSHVDAILYEYPTCSHKFCHKV